MKTETVDIKTIKLDPSNVRKHDERNLDAIKGSLAKFGQQKPIVVGPDNVIVAGNGTFCAARALEWDSLDVVRTDLAGAEAIAFAIADNRTSELAEWGPDLAEAMASLQKDESIDHLVAGFTDAEIETLTGGYSVSATGFPEIPEGDRDRFTQMTFTVSDSQAETLKGAMARAAEDGPYIDSPNENSNGNAIARVAEWYLEQR